MGLILDTSVLIDSERRLLDAAEMLERLPVERGEVVAISTVTLMEFANGIARASSPERKIRRERFMEDVRALMPILSFDSDLAIKAGLLNGELQKHGVAVGSVDLMIGVTALASGFSVATSNVRHFRLIPGLDVVEM